MSHPRALFFKARDEHARPRHDVVTARPESVQSGRVTTRGPESTKSLRGPHPAPEALLEKVWPPMLATLADAPPPDEDAWVCEVKYDGFRGLAALSGGRVALWSRNRLDLGGRFPEVVRALEGVVVGEAVIDGEAVAFDGEGDSQFERLQQGGSCGFVAFDLLWLDGEDLRARPLEERRDRLISVLSNVPPPIGLAERIEGGPSRALEWARPRGLEGIVAKQRGSIYEGRRSRSWLKLKLNASQELAIIGFTPSTADARQIGALLLGVYDGGALRYAGKVGTGFTARKRAELKALLERDTVEESPAADAPRMRDATWVKPRHVAQVEFTEWTADGRLRHPSFHGLRDDKRPDECVRERPAAIVEKPRIHLTHPDKRLYPEDGISKREVADYYASVAVPMVRALDGRPIAFVQFPKGIDHAGIFRQDVGRDRKPWMTIAETPSQKRPVKHLVVDKPEALAWLAQYNALDIHMWSSRKDSLGMPDWVVFDLDPAEGIEQAIEVALALRALLEELRLPSLPKTTGKRGLHVLVPLAPGHTHDDALAFAVKVGETLAGALPQTTMERALAKRRGRLYLDCLQNGYGKTIVAPYSLRGVAGSPASAPLAWDEVKAGLDPAAFNLRTLRARLDAVGDLFAPVLAHGVRLPRFK